jgi:hypothetical protein
VLVEIMTFIKREEGERRWERIHWLVEILIKSEVCKRWWERVNSSIKQWPKTEV